MNKETFKIKKLALANHARAVNYYDDFIKKASEEVRGDKKGMSLIRDMNESMTHNVFSFNRLTTFYEMLKKHIEEKKQLP
jgi:hypothetical protein|tara:strand:+ start:633 stop:872 length:240 start_codon:yes stop_codon:yes gene_type:complete